MKKYLFEMFCSVLALSFVLCLIVGSVVVAQEKKTDPLALNEAEIRALEGFVKQSQELAEQNKRFQEAIGKAAEKLRLVVKDIEATDAVIAGSAARFTSLLDQNDVLLQKQNSLNTEVNTWLTAVRNRVKCEDCILDADGKKLKKPDVKSSGTNIIISQ